MEFDIIKKFKLCLNGTFFFLNNETLRLVTLIWIWFLFFFFVVSKKRRERKRRNTNREKKGKSLIRSLVALLNPSLNLSLK